MREIRKIIRDWIEKGIGYPEAVGVRATNVEGIIEIALFGVDTRIRGELGKVIAFQVYHDRTHYPVIDEMANGYGSGRDHFLQWHGTKNQIENNKQAYASIYGVLGSPEARILGLANYPSIGGIIDIDEELMKKIAEDRDLSLSQVQDLVQKAQRRQGIQFSLTHKVLEDFQIRHDDPGDTFIYGLDGRLSQRYISGIKIYTQLEMDELMRAIENL